MKVDELNLLSTCFMAAAVVVSLTAPTRSQNNISGNETQTSSRRYDSDGFPALVESTDQDFVVKFKGEILSWRNLSRLLREHNISVPSEENVLTAVLKQKNLSYQSCHDRCFSEERTDNLDFKSCFCDKSCERMGDCCLDFRSRCGNIENVAVDDASLHNMTCGDINHPLRSNGVIMQSSCGSSDRQSANDCQPIQNLGMTLQKELPVFDGAQNVTYRSIGCARCNSGGNLSFWGLNMSCRRSSAGSIASPLNINAVKRFLKEHPYCSWKYSPLRNLKQHHKSCVLHDTRCASYQLPVMSVVKELCYSYSMVFSFRVKRIELIYRNPHCALCNPGGNWKLRSYLDNVGGMPPPWSILLDVSSNILNPEERKNSPPAINSVLETHDLKPQMFNCTSTIVNCTVTFEGQMCKVFTSVDNQSIQMPHLLNKNRMILMTSTQNLFDNSTMDGKGNITYIFCPEHQGGHGSPILIYFTFVGILLSIISLCFLLSVYLSFKELRNLPGKCLINLCLALLCYKAIFLSISKSKEVDVLCKAVAIFLHFFILAAFSWMSVMAFDTANTFTVQVRNIRKQPSDIRNTFIKYCIVGWGLPAVIVGLCSALDVLGTFHFGYGNSTYCWISNKTAIAVAMVTPVSLALVFNIACLAKNVHAIRHLQQGANQAANKSSRASLTLICIKLTTVMGLTWVLALLVNWKQTSFLQYPSTVLNSMQGFFITLCFTTTKKVRSLLKEGFYKRWNGAAEPQTSATRDQCTGNTNTVSASSSNAFNMKYLSREQAMQSSS